MKKIISIVCFVVAGVCLVKAIGIGFQNPDMTGTRMFINHWPSYLVFFISLIIGSILLEEWFK